MLYGQNLQIGDKRDNVWFGDGIDGHAMTGKVDAESCWGYGW